jgi:hypothetical protein
MNHVNNHNQIYNKNMIATSFDSRCIDSISDNLFFYNLIGRKIVKLNFSNICPGEVCLVDILQEYPEIIALGIGVGNDISIFERKGSSLYNSPFIKHIIIHYYPQNSPALALPKNLDELVLEFPFVVEGKPVSDYLRKVVTRECKPTLRLLHLENLKKMDEFIVPENIRMVIFPQTSIPVTGFINRMGELGFIKTDVPNEHVFERKGPS